MGLKLKDVVIKHEIEISDLENKRLVIDSYNILYQFLASIRQKDGTPLQDSSGNTTSHLSGLFHRSAKLMQGGVKIAYVFDGKPPKLKEAERERRAEIKQEAQRQYDVAKEREDIDAMRKYSQRTSMLTKEMVKEAKELIQAMGLPVINAPSEGEAQAAYMVNKGDAYGEVSQDYDCLMFGVPKLIQNLTISEKRKLPGKASYMTVKPTMIDLKENLKHLQIDQEQLIMIGILIGTDYNRDGIKGVGQKKAIDLVKKYKDDYDNMFKDLKWDDYFEITWQEVYDTIKNVPTTDDYTLEWKNADLDKIREILVEQHDFSRERVDLTLEKLGETLKKKSQKGLSDFFGK